jgi:hypothetical protein
MKVLVALASLPQLSEKRDGLSSAEDLEESLGVTSPTNPESVHVQFNVRRYRSAGLGRLLVR